MDIDAARIEIITNGTHGRKHEGNGHERKAEYFLSATLRAAY
jgi:hypothetical protein